MVLNPDFCATVMVFINILVCREICYRSLNSLVFSLRMSLVFRLFVNIYSVVQLQQCFITLFLKIKMYNVVLLQCI